MRTAILSLMMILCSAPAARAASDLAYYQQFLYKATTDADGNISTQFLVSKSDQGTPGFPTGGTFQGQAVDANFQIFLMPDGTYTAKYQEMTAQGMPITFPFFVKFTGTWSVPDNQLLLGDIATGARAVYEGRNAVLITFLKDLKTPGLKGKTAVLDYDFSNETPDNP